MNREQLQTILWLRWRLTRNQWMRHGSIGAAIAAVVAVAVFVLGGASFVGAWFAGRFGLGQATPATVMGVWLGITAGFLFLWILGLVNEIQRSETIDLQRLLHLPAGLGQFFVVNYLASHLTVSIVIMVPLMMGLSAGLAMARSPRMVLLVPLALSMVFMVTAWTYCLRGWLAALMANPRRRRTIIMGITLVFILMAQGPNLYFNVLNRGNRRPPAASSDEPGRQREMRKAADQKRFDQLQVAQRFIPPLWVPMGAQALAEGQVLPALFGTLGSLALGALGLSRAYRGTLRFYRGETGGKAAAKARPVRVPTAAPAAAGAGSRFLELRLSAVPEQAAVLALATFRSMLRAPEVKMAWASSFLVTLILGASLLLRSSSNLPEAAKPFIATGAMAFPIFMLMQSFANQFGFDRDGFRALVLSPADRRLILLGKNLACLPVGAGFGFILLMLVAVRLRLPPLVALAGVFQLTTLLFLAGLAGNLLSILVPYRIQSGSLKPTKMPGLALLVMIFSQMLLPAAMAPVFVPPLAELLWHAAGWPGAVPVNLLLSVALTALAALAYWQTLAPLGRLLQRRETKILGVVTTEVE